MFAFKEAQIILQTRMIFKLYQRQCYSASNKVTAWIIYAGCTGKDGERILFSIYAYPKTKMDTSEHGLCSGRDSNRVRPEYTSHTYSVLNVISGLTWAPRPLVSVFSFPQCGGWQFLWPPHRFLVSLRQLMSLSLKMVYSVTTEQQWLFNDIGPTALMPRTILICKREKNVGMKKLSRNIVFRVNCGRYFEH
jgi:hypothetical protein